MDAFTLKLKLIMEQIDFIEEQVAVLEEAISKVLEELRQDPDQLYRHVLETIIGIGLTLTAAIIGEVGDISRFPNAKVLVAAYAGLDATVCASGQFEITRNRISKRVSPKLLNSLWLAAVSARRFNPELKDYYDMKKIQGKHSNLATIVVARRLVHLIYSIWRNNRPFEEGHQWVPPGGEI